MRHLAGEPAEILPHPAQETLDLRRLRFRKTALHVDTGDLMGRHHRTELAHQFAGRVGGPVDALGPVPAGIGIPGGGFEPPADPGQQGGIALGFNHHKGLAILARGVHEVAQQPVQGRRIGKAGGDRPGVDLVAGFGVEADPVLLGRDQAGLVGGRQVL